jgi:hypothetical protein
LVDHKKHYAFYHAGGDPGSVIPMFLMYVTMFAVTYFILKMCLFRVSEKDLAERDDEYKPL